MLDLTLYNVFNLFVNNINCISPETFSLWFLFSPLSLGFFCRMHLHLLAGITTKRIFIVKSKFRYLWRWSPCDCGMTPCELTLFLSLILSLYRHKKFGLRGPLIKENVFTNFPPRTRPGNYALFKWLFITCGKHMAFNSSYVIIIWTWLQNSSKQLKFIIKSI